LGEPMGAVEREVGMTSDAGFDEFYQSAFGRLVGQVYLVTGDLGPGPVAPPISVDRVTLAEALRTLPRSYRQVLVLHHLLELPVEQVARELGIPTGTVKGRLSRGRRALAARLCDRAILSRFPASAASRPVPSSQVTSSVPSG
jgi:hypothetical protein